MRRADRLFQILVYLRKRRAVTARELASRLEVSERTIYRDVRDLTLSGVPINGEAGVGYRLRSGFELAPLMFTPDELLALRIGARMVGSWADESLSRAAQTALARIDAVLPDHLRGDDDRLAIFAPDFFVDDDVRASVGALREAISDCRRTRLGYRDREGKATQRDIRPLGLFFWGGTWTVAGWCELRKDFREFRLDRIVELGVLPDRFETETGRTLEDYLARVEVDER